MEDMHCVEFRLLVACWRLGQAIDQRPFDLFDECLWVGTSKQRTLLKQEFAQHIASCGDCRFLLENGEPLLGL